MTISDIVSSIYIKTKTNSSSYPAADMLIAINNAYERVTSLIIKSDGRWQFDDTNQTDLPIATTALVADQQDYTLAVTHLRVTRVEIKDVSGNWRKLKPIDQEDLFDTTLSDFQKTSGAPIYYDKIGNSIFLYPKPNYSQVASLKAYFQRGPASFTSGEVSTGTKQPGFNSLYHDLIPLWVAYNYAIDNSQPTANGYLTEIMRKEDALKEDYALKGKDDKPRFRILEQNNR